jgi:hypothetical protein
VPVALLGRVVVSVRMVAGDQHAGDRSVAGQPPGGFRGEWSDPGAGAAGGAGLAEQAGQLDGDRDLWAHPAGLWEPAALQGATGQLRQGIGASLRPCVLVLGAARPRQRLQGGQQGLAGVGFQ